jgi:uncharacterized membrane protein
MNELPLADYNAAKQSRSVESSERPIRSLAKAISWRVTGSIDTMMLSWFFTGNLTIAAAIGLTEVVTKMVLYYLHERIWNRISLGRSCAVGGAGTRDEIGADHNLRPAPETE